MPQSEPSRRDRAPDRQDPERQGSVRDRLELIGLVLRELDFLRQRQELLVRTALQEEEVQEAQLDPEENLLVLNHVRRRDAALISQLHQLDQQIQDLRLDPDQDPSQDQLEPDSRPSSGFYELSDGTSASLSNSSHSVFSEGFCSAADSEGPGPLKEKPDGSSDRDLLVGGLGGDGSSWSHQPCLDPAPLLVPKEFQSKVFSGLVVQNVSGTCRYPVPPRSEAVQDQDSPQTRDRAGTEPEPQDSVLQSQSSQHLDRYIYSLLQRRAQSTRTSRPRTSFCTDLSKTILRHAGLYGRPGPGPDSGLGSPKSSFHPGGTSAGPGPVSSSQEQNVSPGLRVHSDPSSPGGPVPLRDSKRGKGPPSVRDFRTQGSPSTDSAHKRPHQPCCPPDQDLDPKPLQGDGLGSRWENPGRTKTSSSRNGSQLPQSVPAKNPEKPVPQIFSLGTGEGDGPGTQVGLTWNLTKQQNLKNHRGTGKTSKTVLRTLVVPESNELPLETAGGKSVLKSGSRTVLDHMKTPHRAKALRKRSVSNPVSERRVLDKPKSSSLQSTGSRPQRHGVPRPCSLHRRASKREDHRRLQVISEVPSDRGTRRVPQRHRHLRPVPRGPRTGPDSCGTGSDSEYSAECPSLLHSTVPDSSEDDRSNCTTDHFGDSESSQDQDQDRSVDEDPQEGVGGGPAVRGRGARRPGPKQDPSLTKTLVKIKVSHNLKKKILRSRSGSLKLMTTV